MADIRAEAAKHFPSLFTAAEAELFPWHTLMTYPRIVERMEAMWGKREMKDELDELILSDRASRAGFPLEVLFELAQVKELVLSLHPAWAGSENDPMAKSSLVTSDFAGIATPDARDRRAENKKNEKTAATFFPPPQTKPPAPPPAEHQSAARALRTEWPGEIKKPETLRDFCLARAKGMPRKRDNRRLGTILVSAGACSQETMDANLKKFSELPGGELLGAYLAKHGAIMQSDIIRAVCQQEGFPLVHLPSMPFDPEASKGIPLEVCRAKMAVPLAVFGNMLIVACTNPPAFPDKSYFSILSGLEVELVCAKKEHIVARLDGAPPPATAAAAPANPAPGKPGTSAAGPRKDDELPSGGDGAEPRLDMSAMAGLFREIGANATFSSSADINKTIAEVAAEDSPVAKLCRTMILDAVKVRASDIHIEAFSAMACVRFRVDGNMGLYSEYPQYLHDAIISRLKIMAGLDISEKRKGQDGKISIFCDDGVSRELRLATIPVVGGHEGAVLRVLAAASAVTVRQLGLSLKDLDRLTAAAEMPHGLVLACGPTGSGKTTVLHAIVRHLNDGERKIWTVEDPVEITQAGVCQSQVNVKAGWNFSTALRSFLRADPDVIMVGEMRDTETAMVSLEASMTGHMVLSTLHTNSASETCTRLLDLGVDPFTLSDALRAVISSRLLPRLCSCSKSRILLPTERESVAVEALSALGIHKPSMSAIASKIAELESSQGRALALRDPVGCQKCHGKGVAGRVAVFEVLVPDETIARLILRRAPTSDISAAAIEAGMTPLRYASLSLALAGIVDLRSSRSV